MSFSWHRVGAIFRKELRDYRRSRFVIGTMTTVPIVFISAPVIQLFAANAATDTARLDSRIGLSLLYMLVIPAVVPSALSAYSVVGEREQGTLEPVLTTPISTVHTRPGISLKPFTNRLLRATPQGITMTNADYVEGSGSPSGNRSCGGCLLGAPVAIWADPVPTGTSGGGRAAGWLRGSLVNRPTENLW
ncbi:MAG TPA: ABC transporter permease [Pseudonocardiaceae bacterium]|jgi:hypothetical protein